MNPFLKVCRSALMRISVLCCEWANVIVWNTVVYHVSLYVSLVTVCVTNITMQIKMQIKQLSRLRTCSYPTSLQPLYKAYMIVMDKLKHRASFR